MSERTGGGRTGARRGTPGGPAAAQADGAPTPRGKTTTYRGVRWRKDPDGTIGWFNEGAGGWMRWRPGGDAPPLPPAWEADAAAVPVPPRVQRASWRSPYRLIPIVLVFAAVVVGVAQATGGDRNATQAARRDAEKLLGRCLPLAGTKAGVYSTTPVACTAPDAAVKVVKVVTPGTSGAGCPSGATAVRLSYIGTVTPDVECVTDVRHG